MSEVGVEDEGSFSSVKQQMEDLVLVTELSKMYPKLKCEQETSKPTEIDDYFENSIAQINFSVVTSKLKSNLV
jgi:hypothetical protein